MREEHEALRTGRAREKGLRSVAFINRKHKDLNRGRQIFCRSGSILSCAGHVVSVRVSQLARQKRP